MNYLIVYSHPNKASFNHAIKETVVNCLKNNSCYYDWYIGITSLFEFLIHSRLNKNIFNKYS